MAAKGEVKVKITLDDGSTIMATRKEIDKLNASMQKTNATGKKTVAGGNTLKRNLEGVGQRAGSTSKDFSRMSQGMGGLVQAYATVAANVFALSTAFNVLSAATNFQDMISSARNLSAELGTSFLTTATAIQKATKAQIDFRTALRAANKASASGISAENVTKFAEAAAKSAQTFGGTTTDALNRMVTAILQGETELLKEVGIVISSNEAFLQYGITIGKAANQLTSFEKRQALSNAVLKESDRLFAGTEIQVNNYEVLAANLKDAAQEALNFVNNSLGISAVIGTIADSIPLMAVGVGLFAKSIISKLVPSVDSALAKAKEAGAKSTDLANKARAKAIEAEKGAGILELEAAVKNDQALLAQEKQASQQRIQILVDEGKLKASALRKGSTLQKAAAGEAITARGVNQLASRNVALATRRKTKDDPGLRNKDSKAVVQGLNSIVAAEKQAAQSAEKLAVAQGKVAKSSRSLATSVSLAKQQLIASNQSTRASILTATQGAGAWSFYGIAIKATRDNLNAMDLAAKKAGTSLTFMQKAGARAALTMSVLGKTISTAFKFLTGAVIVVQTLLFALEAFGIELFKTTKAEKAVEEASEAMSEAFAESEKTLNGMIESFKRFDELDSSTAFQKRSIAIGNFIREISGNLSTAVGVGITQLTNLSNTVKTQADIEKRAAEASDRVQEKSLQLKFKGGKARREILDELLILQRLEIKANQELAASNDKLSESTVSTAKVSNLGAESITQLIAVAGQFEASNIKFPLLDELKSLEVVNKVLGDSAGEITTVAQLFRRFNTSAKEGSKDTLTYLKSLIELSTGMTAVGERSLAAGNAIKEINAQVVLFEGAATRINKTVFSSDSITNYAKLIETASKGVSSLGGSPEGLDNLAASLGVTLDEVLAQVDSLVLKLQKAGKETEQRISQIAQLKSLEARSKLEQSILDTFTAQFEQVKLRETFEQTAQKKRIQNLRVRLSLLKDIKGDKVSNERNELEKEIALETKRLQVQEKGRKSATFAAKEQASIRQNKREVSNLNLQILSAEQNISKVIGDISSQIGLRAKIENAQIGRKKQDLAFDKIALETQFKLGNIHKEKFERDKALLEQRKEIIALQEKELKLQQQLRSGEETFKSANSRTQGGGQAISGQEAFGAFMIEGAKSFLNEIEKNNPLLTLSTGVLTAMDKAVESLVSTIGTGDDDFKGIITAIEETLHSAILDATSQAIKQELKQLLFGDTLAKQADAAGVQSAATLVRIEGLLGSGGPQAVKTGSNSNIFSGVTDFFGSLFGPAGGEIVGPAPTPFANGGVVHKPTFSMIGEGKNSEAVVPLPNNREIPVRLEGGGSGNSEVTNNFDFSGADAKTETRLRAFVEQNRKGAFSDVFNEINRGGSFAKISGRRK